MSRVATSRAAPAAGGQGNQDDICPVCKSSRYLNISMRFLVNPECYHKMCESCVDRIFSHGPNKCPIAGCHRTLRKQRFRQQTFEDIVVEREVDIRKRIATIFNRREDDFESVMDYNNYLNEVEDITFNLINREQIEATERRISAYAEANSKAITTNAALASQETEDYSALQAAEREQSRLRRQAARREEEDESRARAEGKQDIINRLASGTGDADKIAEEGQRITLKKRLDKRAATERQKELQATAAVNDSLNGSSSFVIKGLKAKKDPAVEAPFDAFGGLSFSHKAYHTVQDDYDWNWLEELKTVPAYGAGGYSPHEFYSRALCEAFSGLGVIVGRETTASSAAMSIVSAVAAGAGAKDVKMEDPF
ncbi:CDK-activating kinase assembly factor MAT1-domain-containing protein [Delphinella strobiligena]|nr:CDK-activating kinase assembly factor MAT1-domain-containing protein [Delphinella strobiligena]